MKAPNDLSLPADDPNAFWGFCPDPQPCRPIVSFTGEGLFGWTRNSPLNVPLVTLTTAPNSTTSFGAIGQNGTVILHGTNGLDPGTFAGGRATAVLDLQDRFWWFLPVEVTGFYLTSNYRGFTALSDTQGLIPLARPILAAELGNETAYVSAFPGLASGSITVSANGQLWNIETNSVGHTGIVQFEEGELTSIQLLGGIRYTKLTENLQVTSTTTSLDDQFGLFFAGTQFGHGNMTTVVDSFQTQNYFIGAQVGARVDWQTGPLFVNFLVKGAIGYMDEKVNINGFSALKDPFGNLTVVPTGILAVASNSGQFRKHEFAFIPEGQLNVGLELNQYFRIHLGYDIIYLSSVARPGDHVNRAVDTRQIATDPNFDPAFLRGSPPFILRTTDFLMQGLAVGLTISY
jgi:hypothetical protein